MTKTIEPKPVREARAAARRMARKTDLGYQQALDRVARDAGAEHWAAFTARHPACPVENEATAPGTPDSQDGTTRRSGLRPLVRAIASGEMAERALAGNEADAAKEARHGFSPETNAVSIVLFVSVMLDGFDAPLTTFLAPALLALLLVHSLRRIARLVGDHPSMAMRRRQLRDAATMGMILCVAFSLGAYWPEILHLTERTTGLPQERIVVAGAVGAAIMYAIRRHGVAVMLMEAPATIPRFERGSPVSGYLVSTWFARALQVCIVTGTAACVIGLTTMFVSSAVVLLHMASWPMLYGIGGVAAAAGFLVAGTAHGIESRLRRSGYLEGPTIMSRLSPI